MLTPPDDPVARIGHFLNLCGSELRVHGRPWLDEKTNTGSPQSKKKRRRSRKTNGPAPSAHGLQTLDESDARRTVEVAFENLCQAGFGFTAYRVEGNIEKRLYLLRLIRSHLEPVHKPLASFGMQLGFVVIANRSEDRGWTTADPHQAIVEEIDNFHETIDALLTAVKAILKDLPSFVLENRENIGFHHPTRTAEGLSVEKRVALLMDELTAGVKAGRTVHLNKKLFSLMIATANQTHS